MSTQSSSEPWQASANDAVGCVMNGGSMDELRFERLHKKFGDALARCERDIRMAPTQAAEMTSIPQSEPVAAASASVEIIPSFAVIANHEATPARTWSPSPVFDSRRVNGDGVRESRPIVMPGGTGSWRQRIDWSAALRLDPLIVETANRHDVDPLLLHSVAFVESRHRTGVVSSAGAIGLMQVMPATGARMGVKSAGDLFDPKINLDASAAYLKHLQRRFGNDLRLVLAAYNAGEGAVARYGNDVPPFRETRDYVDEVLTMYRDILSARAAQDK